MHSQEKLASIAAGVISTPVHNLSVERDQFDLVPCLLHSLSSYLASQYCRSLYWS